MKQEKTRIYLLDALRGLAILLMVVHHGAYDWNDWFGGLDPILQSGWLWFARLIFVGLFILISGASTQFSLNNGKRGLQMLAVALLISLVTWAMNPDFFVVFGIIHFMAVAALLYQWIGDIRIHPAALAALFVLSYILLLTRNYPIQHLWVFGITGPSFSSSDYFPILPWIFVYYIGVWLGKKLVLHQGPVWVYQARCRPLETVGRHTLAIYVLHQPVFYGVYWLWQQLK